MNNLTFNPNQARIDRDYYTRLIIGHRMELTLGRPLVAYAAAEAVPAKWGTLRPGATSNNWRSRVIAMCLVAIVGPALVYLGSTIPGYISKYRGDVNEPTAGLPVANARGGSGAVLVSNQEYTPAGQAQQPVAPVALSPMPMPTPMPETGTLPGVIAFTKQSAIAPRQPVALAEPNKEKAPPAGQADAEKDKKDPPPAVVVDDGPDLQGKAQPTTTDSQSQPKVARSQPPSGAKPSAPSSVLPNVQSDNPQAGIRLAKPVEDRAAGVASMSSSDRETRPAQSVKAPGDAVTKITILDIPSGGKSVLVTNPSTRMPVKLLVGDKLPNGKVIKSIDEKSGSVITDGATYKLD